jgi:hypothetical protein
MDLESVTVIEYVMLPEFAGIPEISPLFDNVSPAGTDPENVYGMVPPAAAS